MINQTYNSLDKTTKNFLSAIEAASVLYMIENTSETEHTIVRVRLRDAFEEYFESIIKTEDSTGIESTQRAQEVVRTAIREFMEAEEFAGRQTLIAEDLDAYDAVLTQTLLYATMK